MAKINVLDKKTAELIAAGEVIERPSSVVKELTENAIDAGASAITVEIQSGGIRLIRVTDNGCGIEREDVSKAFLRHATSKVATQEDLYKIGTLGFRGEALASICAVARVELLTRTAQEAMGTRYGIQGGEEEGLDDAGCPTGTTIVVRDLFYNIPARMKFLKKDVTEGNAVATLMDRLALSHPEVSFKLIKDGQMKLHTPGDGKLLSAIYAVYGGDFGGGLVPVDYSGAGLGVTGYLTRPEKSKATRGMEHFFINDRYVKSVTMMAALEEAYRNSLMTGKYPGCVLNLRLPFGMVDVNVHPAKLEVKLSDERVVFDAVYSACKGALSSLGGVTQARDASKSYQEKLSYFEITNKPLGGEQQRLSAQEYRKNYATQAEKPQAAPLRTIPRPAVEKPLPKPLPESLFQDQGGAELYRAALPPRGQQRTPPPVAERPVPVKPEAPAVIRPATAAPEERPAPPEPEREELLLLGEAFHTYILAQNSRELLLIDKHAAHERILFERLKASQEAGEIPRQLLLASVRVALPKDQYDVLVQNLSQTEKAGFGIEDFGDGSVLVREIPSILDIGQVEGMVLEMAELFAQNRTRLNLALFDDLYHSIACKAAVKGGSFTGQEEQQELLELLAKNPNIRNCPHGRPVMISMTKRELEKMFGRIV